MLDYMEMALAHMLHPDKVTTSNTAEFLLLLLTVFPLKLDFNCLDSPEN